MLPLLKMLELLQLNVTLSAASAKSITVDYASADATATAGSDYYAISSTTLTFAAGQTSKTFSCNYQNDTLDENG